MIGDRATLIARLSFVNYYRLSAYWWPFRKPGTTALERLDEFIEGTEFTTGVGPLRVRDRSEKHGLRPPIFGATSPTVVCTFPIDAPRPSL